MGQTPGDVGMSRISEARASRPPSAKVAWTSPALHFAAAAQGRNMPEAGIMHSAISPQSIASRRRLLARTDHERPCRHLDPDRPGIVLNALRDMRPDGAQRLRILPA